MKAKDLIGMRFGKLVVKKRVENIRGGTAWLCFCDCGNKKIIAGTSLTRKNGTKSCGCLIGKTGIKARLKGLNNPNFRHGMKKTRLYSIWRAMRKRCYQKTHPAYDRYHNLGVCPEWNNDFCKFKDWALSNGYTDNLTLDRIDNAKGYWPENCRWVDWKIQENNKRNSIKVLYNGGTLTLAEYAEKETICYSSAWNRFRKGKIKGV